ncbi:hypothetical protein Cgig2_011867 [Carnegiea gigantea]|uniref:Uncharacterized protein n=1 Tax=Carnegiea gigantea TaxID=171969 RepID=A0A9Q1K942_9CARY|nr:hypothetical protein Cgig2_011867 [Carnegiea gigantea]
MGEGNSCNKTDETKSGYENEEGDSGTSSSSVSLEEAASISSSRKLGEGRCNRRIGMIEVAENPVVKYKPFAMDRHPVRALIECWNSNTKSFKLRRREVPFSVYNVALIMGLPVYGKSVSFERNEVTSEVGELLKGAMADYVSRERGRRRTMVKDMRIYRNYVSVGFYEHTNIYSFADDKCLPQISRWVHLYKGKKYDTREMVVGIQESQIHLVLDVREEERAQAGVRTFFRSDEHHGYVEDAEHAVQGGPMVIARPSSTTSGGQLQQSSHCGTMTISARYCCMRS